MNGIRTAKLHVREALDILELAIGKGKVSPIERDLILDKLRRAYDSILFEHEEEKSATIIHQTSQAPTQIKVERVPEIPIRPTTPEIKPQGETIVKPKATEKQVVVVEKKRIEPVYEKPIVVETPPIEKEEIEMENEMIEPVQETPIEKEIPIEPIDEEKIELIADDSQPVAHSTQTDDNDTRQTGEVLGERYQGKRKFRNETISTQTGRQDVASKLQNRPISDLTRAIGINDKFLFIKELFEGNGDKYKATIKQLNQFSDINEALFYIQDHFHWDSNNEAANKLLDLVRRKLMTE